MKASVRKYKTVKDSDECLVKRSTSVRARMLGDLFPNHTPRTERVFDFLMGLSDTEFRQLCDQEGVTVSISHDKLKKIAVEVDKTLGTVTLPPPCDDFDDDDEDEFEEFDDIFTMTDDDIDKEVDEDLRRKMAQMPRKMANVA
jgi:hypothetical protein